MTFGKYVSLLLALTFSSSLAVGLVLGILIMVTGGVEGSISLDINLSRSDVMWFLLGIPLILTLLFFLITPLSFFIHAWVARAWAVCFGVRSKKDGDVINE